MKKLLDIIYSLLHCKNSKVIQSVNPLLNTFFCVTLMMNCPNNFIIKLEWLKQGNVKICDQRHKKNSERKKKTSRRNLCLERTVIVKYRKSGKAARNTRWACYNYLCHCNTMVTNFHEVTQAPLEEHESSSSNSSPTPTPTSTHPIMELWSYLIGKVKSKWRMGVT